MTAHSILELKRQLDVAESAAAQANARASEARRAYNDARCAEKVREFEAMGGVVGVTKVRTENYWNGLGKPDMKSGPFFVTGARAHYGSVSFTLAGIKKDGTASAGKTGGHPERVFIVPEDNQ